MKHIFDGQYTISTNNKIVELIKQELLRYANIF